MKQHVMKILKGNRVTIPKEIIQQMKLAHVEWVSLSVEGNKIILQPCEIVPRKVTKQ